MVRMYGARHRHYSALLCYGTLTQYVLGNGARGNCVVYYGFNVVKLLCGARQAQYVPGNGARATPPEVSWTGAAFLLLVAALPLLLLLLLLLLLAR